MQDTSPVAQGHANKGGLAVNLDAMEGGQRAVGERDRAVRRITKWRCFEGCASGVPWTGTVPTRAAGQATAPPALNSPP